MTSDATGTTRATLRPVRFRAFPVAVVVDGTLYEPALLYATEDATEVWVAGENQSTERVATFGETTARERAKGTLASEEGGRRLLFVARFADGSSLEVAKAPGCGCGHPLRNFTPPAEVSA